MTIHWTLWLAAGATILSGQLLRWKRYVKRLPPGPRKLPFINNLLNMPQKLDCVKFLQMCREHNTDILHLSALGTSMVVLDNYEDARELFDKRSGLYSSRATSQIIHVLSPFGFYFGLSLYGDWWRACRRIFVQHFGPRNADIHLFRSQEAFYVRRFLNQLLDTPDDFRQYIRHLVGSVAISRTYGIKAKAAKDPIIDIVEDLGVTASRIMTSGTYLVDVFPIMRYLPSWFPGTSFHKASQELARCSIYARDAPFTVTERALETEDAEPSFVSELIQEANHSENPEYDLMVLKYTAAQVYAAGAETTASGLSMFFLAMVTYPEVQKKLQSELDEVLHGRLPTHDEIFALPYLNAVVMEVLRWRPVAPFGIPHVSVMEDVYNGYIIPKGSIVIANQWSMLHNPEVYPDPFTFNPERFLKDGKVNPDVRDPSEIAFGFGRRICPGQELAKSILKITVASVASMLDLGKKIGADGQVIEPNQAHDLTAVLCHPEEFACSIVPRNVQAAETIRSWAMEEDREAVNHI